MILRTAMMYRIRSGSTVTSYTKDQRMNRMKVYAQTTVQFLLALRKWDHRSLKTFFSDICIKRGRHCQDYQDHALSSQDNLVGRHYQALKYQQGQKPQLWLIGSAMLSQAGRQAQSFRRDRRSEHLVWYWCLIKSAMLAVSRKGLGLWSATTVMAFAPSE